MFLSSPHFLWDLPALPSPSLCWLIFITFLADHTHTSVDRCPPGIKLLSSHLQGYTVQQVRWLFLRLRFLELGAGSSVLLCSSSLGRPWLSQITVRFLVFPGVSHSRLILHQPTVLVDEWIWIWRWALGWGGTKEKLNFRVGGTSKY